MEEEEKEWIRQAEEEEKEWICMEEEEKEQIQQAEEEEKKSSKPNHVAGHEAAK